MTLVRILLSMAFGTIAVFAAYEAGKRDGRDKGYRMCLGEQDDYPGRARHEYR